MSPEDAAAQAVKAVPGSDLTAHIARLAVCHVLVLPDGPELERWRRLLPEAEDALLSVCVPPRPGLTNIAVTHALRAAEASATLW